MGLTTFFNTLGYTREVVVPPDEDSVILQDIIGYNHSISNKFIDLYFNEGVYAESEGTPEVADFRITNLVAGGVTAISIASIKKPNHYLSASASNVAGGDTIIRFFLTLTGTPDGTETFQIRPVENSVFNEAGIVMEPNKTTGTIALNISPFTLWDAEEPTLNTTTGLGVSAAVDLMANHNLAQTTDADRPLNYLNRAFQFDSANSEFLVGTTNATFQKQQANNFAILVKDLKPNDNQNSNGGHIMSYFNGSNNHGWTLRHGFATNQLNILMIDNVTANQAGFQNCEDRKGSYLVQNESGVLSIYDENNNRVGSQGSISIGTIVWTSISLTVGRRLTQTTNYFNGEWAKLSFINQALTSAQRERLFANLNRKKAGTVGTLTKYMFPVINPSIVSSDKDTMQIFLGDVVYKDWIYHAFYTGNAADGDVDRGFKATKTEDGNPFTPFAKHLTTGSPTVILAPSGVNGTYDENEVFVRSVFYDEFVGEWKMYFTASQTGASPQYTTGLATSSDGITFTKQGQVYTDGLLDVIMFTVVQSGEGDYRAIACTATAGGATNNFSFDYLTSVDGETWVDAGSLNAFFANVILITKMVKVGSEFIIFCTSDNRDAEPSSGTRILMYKTITFNDIHFIGELMRKDEPSERSVAIGGVVQKTDTIEFFYSSLKNQNKTASNGGEGYSAIRMASLDSILIRQPAVSVSYPPWVKKYWPLSQESATGSVFREMIDGDTVTYAGGNWSNALNFYKWVAGAGPVTWANNGLIFSATDFALKMRVEIITTGTINLFSSGTDIVVQLVAGNLRVALNNATKDYITTADIAKPTGITDPGTHVYVGFIWQGGVLRLCVGNTIGIAVTQTVNNAMTNIANGGSSVLICSGATIEARSVVAMSGQTDTQWINTDL